MMAKVSKKQIGFYADPDIEEYLNSLESGIKTRIINASIRAWKETRTSFEEPKVYQDKVESLAGWLAIMTPAIMVSDQAGRTISLAALLEKFLILEKQRPLHKSWVESAERLYAVSKNQCVSCQRHLLPDEVINTPNRGILCRQCFEIPFRR